MSTFRFLHAADIHLDSPLTGLAGIEGGLAERIRPAPRAAFEALVDCARDEGVDFVVIAGDLYDGPWRDFSTGLFFAEQMGRLNEAGVPVFVLHGNHDAESLITKSLPLPDNVRVFGAGEAQTFRLDELGVVLHGRSFPERAVTENLLPGYPDPMPDVFNIGVLHTALEGSEGHATYAPCSLHELVAKGYDYWALGHVHRRQVLHEDPYVVFPGNLQGRHVRETGPKGAAMVTVEDGETVDVTHLTLDVVRWAVLEVDAAGADNRDEVVDRMRMTLNEAVQEADGRLLAVRILLQGRTPLHDQLIADTDDLIAAARSIALGLGDEAAWVERVLVQTVPVADVANAPRPEDQLGDLQRMLADAEGDEELVALLKADIGRLVGALPHPLRDNCEDDLLTAAMAGDYQALMRHVMPWLHARLTAVEQD